MTRNGQPVVFIGRDPKGRRVQFMWLMIALPNATWSGAPTLPREIVLAPPGSAVTGLYFRPLPEMQLLHVGEASNTSLALRSSTTTTGGAGGGGASGGASGGGAAAAAGGGGGGAAAVGSSSSSDSDTWQEIHVADGLHCHVVMSLTIPSVSTVVSIELRAGGAAPHAPGSVMLNVSREKSPCCFDVDQNDPWKWIYEMNKRPFAKTGWDNDDLSTFLLRPDQVGPSCGACGHPSKVPKNPRIFALLTFYPMKRGDLPRQALDEYGGGNKFVKPPTMLCTRGKWLPSEHKQL